MPNQSSPRRNVKTFISILLSYLLLTSQLTPVAFAFNRKSATWGSKEASQKQETASTASTKASRENAALNPPVPQPAPEPLLAPAIVATMDDGLPAATAVAPAGTINYTVNIRNNGVASPADDAANVVFSNMIDAHTTLVAGSAMAAVSDRYNTIGNVQISVPDGATDLLGNDFNLATGNNTGMTVTAETKSSTQCAGCNNVTINANGSFTYNPAVGFSGTDTFTYTAHSGTSTATETVTITVAGEIWFINNNAGACSANCNGRLSNPFISLAAFNAANLGGAGQPGDNDWIFVYESATAYTGPAGLRLGQKLIGQDATASLISLTGFTQPSGMDPLPAMNSGNATIVQITTTAAATNGINLNSGNTLRGFTVGNTTGAKISGNAFGTLTAGNNTTPDVTLNGTGQALTLTNGTLAATSAFTSVTTTSSTSSGVTLTQVAGTVAFGSTTVSGSTLEGIRVSQSTLNVNFGNTAVGTATANSGGTNSVSLASNTSGTRTFGTLTIQNNAGAGNSALLSSAGGNTVAGTTNVSGVVNNGFGIDIRALATGTSVSFGTTTVNKTTAGAAVNLGVAGSGNVGNVTFLSLNATSTNGSALLATDNTGTITVTNNTGSLSATNGFALNITKAAAPLTPVDMDFANVSSSGAANGINLLNLSGTITTTGGALTATGTVFNLSGGTVSVTYSGNITQATNNAMVSIAGGHSTGTITFQTGTVSATNGTGLQFNNADSTGAYNFNGPTTLTGGNAGIDILAGSAGTFNFGSGVSITNPSGTGFVVNASTPTVTYSGNITKSGTSAGLLVDIQGQASGNITFQTGTLSSTSTTGTGIELNNADGTVNFNGTTTLNGGDAAVDIITGSAGTISFGANASITNPTNAAFTVNASTPGVTYSGNITKSGTSAGLLVDIQGQASGTITFQTGTLSSTSSAGTGLSFNNTDGTVNFNGTTTLNGGDSAIDITNGSAGTFGFGGTTITNPSGVALNVDGATGGISISGALSKNSAGRLIDFNNYDTGTANISGALSCTALCDGIEVTNNGVASGTVNFSNASKILNTSADTAVNLDNNDAGTINFTGGNLDIDTTTGGGFNAINGGTVTVQGSGNSISSGTGTALNIANTTIGGSNVTFLSISANGGTSGIVLNTTGTAAGDGGLTVTGDNNATNNGSGGTIQNTSGPGINLTSTKAVNLEQMNVQNSGDDGIRGSSVDGFTLSRSNITNNGNAVGERGIEITELTGSGSMTNCTVTGSAEDNVYILNDGSGNLTSFSVTGSTFATTAQAAPGNDGFIIQNTGSGDMAVSITSSTFTDNRGDHFQASFDATATATASMDVTFSNNTLTTTVANDPNILGGGITLSPSGAGDMTFMVSTNNIQQAFAAAINLNLGTGSLAGSSMNGTVTNNTIGTAGTLDSGSESSDGIDIIGNGAGSTTVTITNNQVRQYSNDSGIKFLMRDGTNSMNATVTGNTVKNPGTFAVNGIHSSAGATAGDNGTMCIHISGNDVATSSANGGTEIRARQRFGTTVRLPGYGGANNDTTAVNTFISGQNSGATTSSVVNVPGGGGFIGGAACTTPLMFAPGGVSASLDWLSAGFSAYLNQSSFDYSNNPPAILSAPTLAGVSDSLTQSQLDSIVVAAIDRWTATGLTQKQIDSLRTIKFDVSDLAGAYLGEAGGNRVQIDRKAGGKGWFVDPTPQDDSEFGNVFSATRRYTDPMGAPAGRIDLLTAIEHEIGHKLGLTDSYAEKDRDTIMYGYLTAGERRLPTTAQAANAQAGRLIGIHHLKLKEKDRKAEGRRPKAESRKNHASTTRTLTAPVSGETVTANIGTLPAGSSVTITYQVTVNNPPNLTLLNPPRISNQGTVTANGGISVQTDDPTVVGVNNPTVTLIDLFNTTTSLVSDLNPSNQGDEVTFTATVNETPAQGTADPTGTVDFIDTSNGNAVICNDVALTAGSAQCQTSTLTTGLHNMRADYSGDGNFDPSQSNLVAQLVVACTANPVVTKIADTNDGVCDADCSLREAIAQVCSLTTITFDTAGVFATPQTITLTLGELSVAKSITIDAPDLAGQHVTVTGNNASRVFNINIGKIVTIRDLTITGGSAAGNFGGAIFNDHATLTLIGVTVSGNTADFGGAIYNNGGPPNNSGVATLTIVNSTISGNTANFSGGAIYNIGVGTGNGGTLNLTNSTLSGNNAKDSGGAVFTDGPVSATPVTITNCTITANRADSDTIGGGSGGGLFFVSSNVILKNTIVDLNFVGGSPSTTPDDIRGTVTAGGASTHNLIGSCLLTCGLTDGVDNNQLNVSAASLNIGPLAANGGIVQTHALLAGSVAIEAGNNTYVVAPPFLNTSPITDERGMGFPRIADSGDAGTTATVDIGAFELHPSLENITDKSTAEDTPFNFNFNLGDDTGALIQTVVGTSSNQTLVPDANLIITGSGGSRNLAITPVADANSPVDGTATITVTVTATNGQTAVDTFVLTVTEVNDNPDAVNDSLTAINEDSGTRVIPFADLLANDTRGPANESSQTITITNVSNPTGGTVVINGMTVEFTPTANFVGTASFDYTITDNGTTNGVLDAKTDTATASFAVVAVNDPPSFTGGANQTVSEDAGAQTVVGWATNISAGPGESQTLTFNVSVTGTTGNLAFTGAPAVNATTGNLTYTTAANTNGTANLSVTLSDDGSNTPPNSNTSAPQPFTITVNAVNDAPTFQLGANPSVGEDAGPQTINNFAFNFQPGPATATDEAGQTLVGYTLTQTGSTGGLTFSSAPAINTSGTLTFTSSAGLSGTATFDVVATDSGPGTPPNVNQSAPISFTITVNSVNDPPVNTVPGPQSTNQNTPLVFSSGNGNQISVADADAGTNDIQVTLTANNGPLTLSGTAGLNFTVGDGTADATMTFTGTIANINTALNGMTFTPTTGFSGIAGVTITTNDQGNTGGAPESDTDSVTIQVLTNISINDARVAEPLTGSSNMLFTVSLSAPASGAVSVDFATADQAPGPGHAVAGSDYTATTGTVNFALGEQVKTIAVPVLSDSDSGEPDETFLVNLTNPSNGNIVDAQATGTITAANPPGTLIISELRTSGPGGAGDDFVEIYNNTNTPHTVPAGGYGLFKQGADCSAAPVLIGTIPAATVIPQRGHYLFVGSTYSLTNYGGTGAAAGDQTLTTDIESDFNVGLFMTVDPLQVSTADRLNAVGFGANTSGVCAVLLEGTTLVLASGSTSEHSFVREFTLLGIDVPTPTDGNDNAADFTVISTTPGTPVGATAAPRLGAPGPENLAGPNLKKFSQVGSQFIDPTLSASVAPNRARDTTPDPANNSTLGTLASRRTFTNNTGAPITRLRFRIYDITTLPSPVGTADLRARTSSNAVVTVTGVGSVTALATTLETPPAQPSSGGLNSSLVAGTVAMGTPLAPGASIHLNFLFGVQQSGSFRVFVFVEAVP